MPSRVWLFVTLSHFFFGGPVLAKAPQRRLWHEKDQFKVEWRTLKNASGRRMGMAFSSQENIAVVLQFTVKQIKPDGSVVLEQLVESVKDEALNGAPDIMPGMMQGGVFRATLDAHLKVVMVEASPSVVKRIVGPEPGPKRDLARAMIEDQCKAWLEDIFFLLPDKPLKKGTRWQQETETHLPGFGREVRTKTFTSEGTDIIDGRQVLKITVQGTEVMRPSNRDETGLAVKHCKAELNKADYKGTLYFDPAVGRLVQAQTRLWTQMSTSFELQGRTFEATGTQDQTTNVRCLDRKPQPAAKKRKPVATPPAVGKPAAVKTFTNGLGMKLVRIPPGKFQMGSARTEEDRQDDEELHEVEITRPFFLGRHEVTIGQYRQFVRATGYHTSSERSGRGCFGYNKATGKMESSPAYSWDYPGWDHTDQHPVVNLSWFDAKAFCDWLSRKEGRTYRLPTEAEWEYACRAGTRTLYSSGDDPETLGTVANVTDASAKKVFPQWRTIQADDGYTFTAPVGRFQPNAFGLYDMHGNALEWCADWHWRYDGETKQDPKGPPAGILRVQRGGSWADFPDQCRSARRTGGDPASWCISSGFRVAADDAPTDN
jgi:formylglycine-generating enzyme required for sulfatase activity